MECIIILFKFQIML